MKGTLIYKVREETSAREHAFEGKSVGYHVAPGGTSPSVFRVWDDQQTVVILLQNLVCLQTVENE